MTLINILKTILLGIVEGITEWLPISSTGHLILLQQLMDFYNGTDYWNMYEVVIQLGAVMAVVVLYFDRLWPFCADKSKRFVKPDVWKLWLKVLVGIAPVAVIGFLFEDGIESLCESIVPEPFVVAAMLILYGVLFIVVERAMRRKPAKISQMDELTWGTAFFIGCAQVLALIPGTSRSGVTIVAALLLGTSRTVAAEYTFFMSVPVMVGTGGWKLLNYMKDSAAAAGEGVSFTEACFTAKADEWWLLLIGMAVSFLVSVLAIKFFIGYIKRNSFTAFGWYRIALGLLVILCFAFLF